MKGLRLGEELGAGAVAAVRRVTAADGRSFAGKILHRSRRGEAAAAERFAREAELVRGVDHPNVVGVFGRHDVEGHDVLLMELVEGPTLETQIAREAPMSPEAIRAMGLGIAKGLAAAHEAGVVHRDLKPANILVAPGGSPKIADFGMARASSLAGVDRDAMTVLGTPDYMAPECIEPLAVDARSDLYALGCILFEMAQGRPPYDGATSFAVLEQHRTAPTPSLADANLPAGLQDVIERLLEKTPADRIQSASAVVDALGRTDSSAALTMREVAPATVGRCASCQAPLVDGLSVCLSCQAVVPRLAAGDHTVFVTGPGEVAAKLDSQVRAKLVDWLRANPTLGVDAAKLEKKIPRLPFALLTRVDAEGSQQLAASLRLLGLQTAVVKGGPLALPEARKKARTLGGRALLIVAASLGGMMGNLASGIWVLALMVAAALIAPLVVALQSSRPTAVLAAAASSLPAALGERMKAVATVGAGMQSRRHRESLRGVVSRALALREAAGADGALDAEVAEAIDQALVATGRLDTIDQGLAGVDLQRPTDAQHALMHERDTWTARLHDLVGTLESLRTRLAAATSGGESEAALARLRNKIEALEEVQADV
ncbi:MAG: serine/threonine-protein kinase [Myxococcota bacterium]